MNHQPPVFLDTPTTKAILEEVTAAVPEGTKVYLFGGTIRNALYYRFFQEEMTQRDYDCIVIGDGEQFAQNLLHAGFIFGKKNTEIAKVLKKARIENPVHEYDDWLYLDCKIYPPEETIESVLAKISDFTISGVALDLHDIETEEWNDTLIAIPHAIEDLKEKKLRLVKAYVTNFHKIIRMVSRGFQNPSPEETRICFEKLKTIEEDRFTTNTEKTVRYLGSEEKVLAIAKELGYGDEILNFSELKNSTH